MTSAVFVHGTGVRRASFDQTFAVLENELRTRAAVTLLPCLWGDACGASLHLDGASVPSFERTRDVRAISAELPEDADVVRWSALYEDPLHELELLAMVTGARDAGDFSPGRTAGTQLDQRLRGTLSESVLVADAARAMSLDYRIDAARAAILETDAYGDARDRARDASAAAALSGVVARAIVAQASADARDEGMLSPYAADPVRRDALVAAIDREIGGEHRGEIFDAIVKRPLSRLVARAGTRYAVNRRGAIFDGAHPAVGDIMLYQTRGNDIRACISAAIADATPPVTVIAHSLGGIASVDLLAMSERDAERVALLVTAGSQAGFVYEIGALTSLRIGESLPAWFPQWLNVYDPRDMLSFLARRVFGGRATDVHVDNRQPFPMSHSAYWTNDAFWTHVTSAMPPANAAWHARTAARTS